MSAAEALAPRRVGRRQLFPALAIGALLALATILRVYHLTSQSLWNDEGTSVALAGRSLPQITLSAAADIHPPLYHYLLHYWLRLFGPGDAAARSLSVVLGVGLVGLTYLLGRRLFDPLAGWLAAFLIAISSYQVYYAQEARMYMLLAFLGAASTYLFYLGWLAPPGPGRRRAIGGWIVVTVLAAYTHYLAAGLVLAQNAAWALSLCLAARYPRTAPGPVGAGLPRPYLRQGLTWLGAQAAVGALYLPWLRLTWGQLHRWPAVSEPFGLLDLLRRALPLFVLGPMVQPQPLHWLTATTLGVVFLGLALPDCPGERAERPTGAVQMPLGRILALLYWGAPLALLYYLSRSRPLYHHKFLLVATPGFALLAGRGLARLFPGRAARAARRPAWLRLGMACGAVLLLVAASLPGLRNYYFDPRYARDDYRGIVRYIAAAGRPGDVVLINAPSQIETVARYHQAPVPLVPIPLERPPHRERTIAQLKEATRGVRHVFGIFWATSESDPERIVESWLDTHAYKALDAWYGSVRLVVYAMPAGQAVGVQHPSRPIGRASRPTGRALDVELGDQVRLEGYSLAASQVASGDVLQLTLFWRAIAPIERRYKVFTHVVDDARHLVGQRDAEPGGGTSLTTSWDVGYSLADRYGLPIRPGTAPGEYLVEVGMYSIDDGQRLPVVRDGRPAGDHVVLQSVRVVRPDAPPPIDALDMHHQRRIAGDDVHLLGFSFGRAGALDQGLVALQPGEVAELVLFWQAERQLPQDLQVSVRVADSAGRVRLERAAPPLGGRYPPGQWAAQEIVRDPMHLPLPADLPPGRYRLLVGWQASSPLEAEPSFAELLAFVVE